MPEPDSTTTVVVPFHRERRKHAVAFTEAPPPRAARRPARVAVMLALAHALRERLTAGDVHDQADIARRLGMTRARVTQLLNLTLLAPLIQEQLLDLDAVDGVEPLHERDLRSITSFVAWDDQWRAWRRLPALAEDGVAANRRKTARKSRNP